MNEIYNGIFWFLHFPAADGLKKSYQLLIGLNETHTMIPVIDVLQVVAVERVLHVQRFYPQYLEENISVAIAVSSFFVSIQNY